VSDIDTAVVDSLKVLDPKRPIREADVPLAGADFRRLRAGVTIEPTTGAKREAGYP
jgi:hypothetical protein